MKVDKIKRVSGGITEKQKIFIIIVAAAVISVIIIGTILTIYNINSDPEEAVELPEPSRRSGMLYYNELDYNEQMIYDQVKAAAEQVIGYTDQFIAECDRESFLEAVRAVYADLPELFYVDYDSLELCESEDGRKLIKMKYKASRAEIESKKAMLEEKLIEIAERAEKYTGSYEKELFLHDYICTNTVLLSTTYAIKEDITDGESEKSVQDIRDDNFSDTAYGPIVNGFGNVKGYALAMKLLMNRCGEHCFLVFGTLNSGEEHVWNIVYVNDKFYHTDVSWDDADIDYSDLKFHAYFNLSEAAITVSRVLSDPDIIPKAVTENDYYSAEGLVAVSESELQRIVCDEIYKACREQREYIEIRPTYTENISNLRSSLEFAFAEAAKELNENGIGIIVTGVGNDSEAGITAKKINLRSAFRIYSASNDRDAYTIQLFYDDAEVN